MARGYPKFNCLGDRIYWAYANLAMFFATIRQGTPKYTQMSFIVRMKVFHGLRTGKMNVHSMFIDQHFKINTGDECAYCGVASTDLAPLALDHILPRSKGGKDTGDNLIKACKSCNSSKGNKDLLEWCKQSDILLSPWVMRN